ncbi:MAG: hypothetical protein ACLFP8_01825 [Alphaproteobacteria bacterium]
MVATTCRNSLTRLFSLPEFGWPTLVSAFLHGGVFLLAVFGLPQVSQKDNPYLQPGEMVMNVELYSPANVIETENAGAEKPLDTGAGDENDSAPPAPRHVYNNQDRVPQLAEPKKPDIEEPVKPAEKPKVVPDPTAIRVPPKPVSKPKKPEPKVEPKPKVEEDKPQEQPAEEQRDMTSLLKDLTPSEEEAANQPSLDHSPTGSGKTVPLGDESRQMTTSDLVALNQGVQQCWNVNAGGRMAENLIVRLRVFVNPDRSVREVVILDQMRYATDSHFKSAADAAKWALLNPKCSTLNLPPEKYETWKSFIYVFDPSQML